MRPSTTRGAILSALAFASPLTLFAAAGTGEFVLGIIVFGALLFGATILRGRPMQSPVTLMLVGASILAASPVVNDIHELVSGSIWDRFSLGESAAVLGYAVLIAGARRLLRERTMAFQWEPVLDATLVSLWVGFVALAVIVEPLAALGSTSVYELIETTTFTGLALIVGWSGLRICLGGATRSWAFVLLVSAQFLVPLSELLFHAGHLGVSERPAAVIGAIGLVTLVAAATSPDAAQLSVPARSDGGSYRIQAVAGLVLSIAGMIVMASIPGAFSVGQTIVLSLIGTVTLARMWLLSQRQQSWVQVNTRLRGAVERLMEQEQLDDILSQAEATALELLAGHRFADVTVLANGVLDESEAEANVDDFIARAIETGVTQRVEFLIDATELGGGRRFASRLAAPVSTGETSVVLVAETIPVLTQDEVAHLEMLMSSVALTLEASRSREETHDRRSNDRFRALVQDSSDIVALVDRKTFAVELVSPTLSRLLGYDETNALGASPLACMHPKDREAIARHLESADGVVAIRATDVRMRHQDGRFLWFAVSVRDLSEEPEVTGFLFSFADIHDRKMTELQMAASETRYRTLVSNSNDVMLLVDDGVITYLTPNVERVFGYRAADLIGVRADAFLDDAGDQEVARLFDDDGLIQSGSDTVVALPTAVGGSRWAQLTFLDPGLAGGEMMISIRDITEQRRLEASLREQALHDPLTGLFNRASVYPELQRTLQRLDRHMTVGVLHLDLVDFKSINDSLGFGAGDALLIEVATRLRAVLRRGDTLARFNGDEFAIVTLCARPQDVEKLIERLQEVFDEPFVIEGRRLDVSAVIGAAQTRQRTESATRLLESAGIALQHAKSTKRRVAIFEEAMREAVAERFELASGMLSGIEQGEFYVVYQPLLDMGTQKVSSVEALLRWQHPERGFVSPGVFIPIAEQSGAIIQLGRWVLQRACEQLVRWHEDLPDGRGLSMSVNVSARQFAVEGEAERMLAIIERTGVDTRSLVMELTESVMLDDAELLRTVLDEFRALGIRVAVDDFGTGAAGLGHLRDIPFDIVKIDKSYIDGLGESEEAHLLITRVIELAHGLNARIVAEGIETPLQARLLKTMRCDYGQGFYLGRPMEPVQIEEWFAQGRAGLAAASIAPAARLDGAAGPLG